MTLSMLSMLSILGDRNESCESHYASGALTTLVGNPESIESSVRDFHEHVEFLPERAFDNLDTGER